MTQAEFEQLRAEVRAFGDALGVVAMLRMVNTQPPANLRVMLRVFRFLPDEPPREQSPAHGYHPDADDLREQIRADVRIAADKLREVTSSAPAATPKDHSQ